MKRASSTEELVKAKLSRFQTQKGKVKEKQLSFKVRENSGYFPSRQRNSKFFDFVKSQGTLFSVNQIYISKYGKIWEGL